MTNANRPIPYADDVETVPADEADDIQRVVRALQSILVRSQANSGQFRADVHFKTHGYARGELRVLPNLPEELAQELFERAAVYQTLSFNVWHALAAHRPLGGINRVRRWAYPFSSAWRRPQAEAKLAEPPSTGEAG